VCADNTCEYVVAADCTALLFFTPWEACRFRAVGRAGRKYEGDVTWLLRIRMAKQLACMNGE
jgi:hypothetical protein